MILRRSTTRRVPSGAIRTRSSSQPPCSARSTSIRVTDAAGELARDGQPLELLLHPGLSARRCAMGRRRGMRIVHALTAHRPQSPSGHVVEGGDDLGGQRQLLDGRATPRSWAAVRAPTIGAVTPGPVAHPGQRHLERATSPAPRRRGRRPRRSAARARRGRRPTKFAKCGEAARESAGVPVRYLPVSTPRPSGDQGRTPSPSAAAAGHDLGSTPRLSREYSTWVEASGARPGHGPLPGGGLGGLPAGVVRDADVRRPAGRDRVVERASASPRAGCRRPRCAPATGRRGRRRAAAARRRGCVSR